MTTEYTIVEPSFEFIEPATDNYLEFLERCTRTCYKSEDKICEGSAEKLMHKVVNEYEHLSVVEHANCIMKIKYTNENMYLSDLLQFITINPLFGGRITWIGPSHMLISGNLRMWKEIVDSEDFSDYPAVHQSIKHALHTKWPFFFQVPLFKGIHIESTDGKAILVDENPLTNRDELTKEQLYKHTTLTYRITCSRSCSHQLVRHRKMSYSQESQRYCNYGKKGLQFIIPPKWRKNQVTESQFISTVLYNYEIYNRAVKEGIPPEDARELLPNAIKTEVVTTGTLADWKHIFEHRADNPKAQWQIKQIMQGIQAHAESILPNIFGE